MDTADVAVIGAGAVGCAMARRFALEGARVVVLEKGADLLSGASKANSAILHTGFDAPAGSLEQACIRDGNAEYMDLRESMNLPVLETGAMVVAWTPQQRDALDGIEHQAIANGVHDVRRLGATEIRQREPHLAGSALEALLVPREHVIDPWSPFLAYLLQAQAHGARILFDAEVGSGSFDGEVWSLQTARHGILRARTVINCAGLFGDRLDRALLGEADFEIRPRKGQFVVFDKAAAALLRTIILPVPTERTKGVVLCRTAFGNLLVGPTAEEQDDRERAGTDEATLRGLVDAAQAMLPALAGMPVTATYAGLRPATEEKHYRISHRPERNWITVGGIRSTGMTAALGIARHVHGLYSHPSPHRPVATPVFPRMPNLAEHLPRDWAMPGFGEMVCHCELVTRREIEAALSGPLPARDLGGLKRRTRCTMGRCQGFGCHARLAALTEGMLSVPMTLLAGAEA
jgi:glycerol-3-phosphate dehydrogenase